MRKRTISITLYLKISYDIILSDNGTSDPTFSLPLFPILVLSDAFYLAKFDFAFYPRQW